MVTSQMGRLVRAKCQSRGKDESCHSDQGRRSNFSLLVSINVVTEQVSKYKTDIRNNLRCPMVDICSTVGLMNISKKLK